MCDYTPEIIFRLSNKDQRFPQKFLLGFRILYPVGFQQDLVFAHKILVSLFLELLCTYNSNRHHFSRRTFMSGTEQNSRIRVCLSTFSLNQPVPPKWCTDCVNFAALLTSMLSLFSMHCHVRFKSLFKAECLVAQFTGVWLNLQMTHFVFVHCNKTTTDYSCCVGSTFALRIL